MLAPGFLEADAPRPPGPGITSSPAAKPQVQASASELSGLSAADLGFLALLVTKPMWSRHQLTELAARFQIMLDGTLERINEAALDQLGDFLIEGDDPIYVQQKFMKVTE